VCATNALIQAGPAAGIDNTTVVPLPLTVKVTSPSVNSAPSVYAVPPLPNVYVMSASGIMLLLTSALIVILSVFASPTVILPSARILPVT
jgi:hypothetical protein